MLDDFSSTKLNDTKISEPASSATKEPGPSGPGRPDDVAESSATGEVDEDDFAKQLQAGFADMMKDLESNPEMAKQFEELMSQFGGPPGAASGPIPPADATAASSVKGPASAATSTPKAAPTSPKPGEGNFQDNIRRTMERMQASDSSAASAQPDGMDNDMLASLMKELASGDGDGEDGLSKMLMGMMEQLTNKDILYEPMKELDTKFPDWLEKNGAGLKKEDKERYDLQRVLVGEIVGRFEKEGYSDSNTADREFIVERMQKVRVGDSSKRVVADIFDSRCKQQAPHLQI